MHAFFLDHTGNSEAPATAEQAVAEAERAGDRYAVAFALHALSAMCHRERDYARARTLIDRALTVAGDDPESVDLRLVLQANRTIHLRLLGQPAEGERAVREMLVLADRTGTPRRTLVRIAAAVFYYFVGRWDDAVAELDVAVDLLDEGPDVSYLRFVAHALRALIAGHQDDQHVLDAHLGAIGGQELTPLLLRDNAESLLLAQALAQERDGHSDRALGILSQALHPGYAETMGERQGCLPTLVRLALAVGDAETARMAVQACVDDAEGDSVPLKTAAASRCLGLLHRDAALLRAAGEAYRTIGDLPDLAMTLEDLAVVCAERGELEQARTAYAEAVEAYTGMGAAWGIRRAQARLHPHGIGGDARGAQARPTTGWYALTPTEVKVARLVADGLSNPDIAAQLFLSRRTVQTYVSHILAKLDASSRREIADIARAVGVPM